MPVGESWYALDAWALYPPSSPPSARHCAESLVSHERPRSSPGRSRPCPLLDGGVDDLAVARGERMPRHLPHAFLVSEAITDLKQHRQDLEGLGRHERESSTPPPRASIERTGIRAAFSLRGWAFLLGHAESILPFPADKLKSSRPFPSRNRSLSNQVSGRPEDPAGGHDPCSDWNDRSSHPSNQPKGDGTMETNKEHVAELLFQARETEKRGVLVYETALRCVVNDDLKEEWEKYLEQTQRHVQIVHGLVEQFGLDPDTETPGRLVVRHIGQSLVLHAMEMALDSGEKESAELVAAECVVEAETKDHLNWELISQVAKSLKGPDGKAFKEACEEVEDQEDEHLYHSTGWCRELWFQSLGLPAVLPPPEEEKDVKTAIGAARAKKARKTML